LGALAIAGAPAAGDGEARPGADPKRERAGVQVEALRAKDDEAAKRELYDLGAAALGPLGDALAGEADPAAWSRLAEAFSSVLEARLSRFDEWFAREEETRRKRVEMGLPASTPEGATATALRQAEAEIRSAGYAASSTLAAAQGVIDELALAARGELLGELYARFHKESADDAPAAMRASLESSLATLGPLAAPLLAAALGPEGDPARRPFAEAVRARAVGRYMAHFTSEAEPLRRFGEEALFGMGDLALKELQALAEKGAPDDRFRARRLVRRIRWGVSDELYLKTGGLLEGFEEATWRERRLRVFELERQGGRDAVPALRRIVVKDPSADVKVAAAEGLARQRDPLGLSFLRSLGMSPITQSPEVVAAIAMDQGIRYLQIRRYEKAIQEFNRVLEAQPSNDIALYNLACAFALKFARDGAVESRDTALDFLEKAVEKGFEDADHLRKDDDLASLREEARFRALEAKLRLGKETRDKAGEGPKGR